MSQIPSLFQIEELLQSFTRAMHPRELASRLRLRPEDYAELLSVLEELREQGKLKTLPGGRVAAVVVPPTRGRRAKTGDKQSTSGKRRLEGTLTMHPRGFGFVVGTGDDDIFIPPDAVFEALHGDTVVVEVTGKSKKGYEGRIFEVKKRRDPKVAGVLRRKRAGCWLDPDDSRLRGPIVVTEGQGRDGEAAVVEIHTFPHFGDELPEARILEVLGPPGDVQTEVRKILIRESVTEEHHPDALRNAEQMATRLSKCRLGKRRDLRDVPLPTIDPEDARDHDDAIWVERQGRGYRAYVAIADVSEYVRAESALDEEARARGCTIYLPDRAIPMLPRVLAGDLCSLLPDQDRYCMCVIADLDARGTVTSFEIVEGLMRSSAKLTYAGVARALGLDPESPQSPMAESYRENLQVLAELAKKLRLARMQRGALDLDLPEARIVVDEESGAPTEVKRRATRPGLKQAYNLVEEMMLLANELVAQFLTERKIPAIYRVHGKPDEEKLERLAKIAQRLNVPFDFDELFEPKGVSAFLKQIENHERKNVLEMLLLRSLKQATYDTDNVGHFGLASDRYLHFTSPIRRYPDLRVHRQIKHILRGGKVDKSDEALDDLKAAAGESSKKERAAMDIEREVMDLYRTIYMRQHLGSVHEGRITGMSGTGLYISVADPCVDILVPFEALGGETYEPDEDELGVVGVRSGEHIMLGDTLTVRVTDAVIERRTIFGRREIEGQDVASDEASLLDSGRTRAEKPGEIIPRGRTRKAFTTSHKTRSTSGSGARGRGHSGQNTRKDAPAGGKKSFKPSRSKTSDTPRERSRPARSTSGSTRKSSSQKKRRG